MTLRRVARYFCRSSSISGSQRHSCLCSIQYALHASLSSFTGRGSVFTCVQSCSLKAYTSLINDNSCHYLAVNSVDVLFSRLYNEVYIQLLSQLYHVVQ